MTLVTSHHARFAAALIALALTLGSPSLARAEIKDYEFRLVESKFKTGPAIIAVRLVHKPEGAAISDAVIFATRLDMAPEGMEAMAAAIEPAPSGETGVYRFKVDLSMAGAWRLSLAAKVQGEIGAVESRLILNASP
jgi:hypothetical protein